MGLLKHNLKPYKELKRSLEVSNDVLLIHGTGMGKSFILIEYLKELSNDIKVLYVVPKLSIVENFKSYKEYKDIHTTIDFCTYNKFSAEEVASDTLNEYDLFIFDEAHHLGSDIYGKNALTILNAVKNNDKKKVIGMTATNEREDGIDVSSYFSEKILGISILEGIQQGIIPPFEYLICGNDARDQLADGEKITDYRQVIEYEEALPLLSETIQKNPKNKWICFFTSIAQLEQYEDFIKKLFPEDYEIIKITSRHDTSVSEVFKHDKVVILSVDKLIEGIHLPKIEGIILFRKVGSLPVFQQILGRLVHVGSTNPPLVLDCTEAAFKLLGKLLARERKISGYFTKGERTQESVKDILYCSIQNIQQFELEQLLLKYYEKDKEFPFRDEIFKNCAECCRTYEVNNDSVKIYARKHNVSKQEAIEYYLSKKKEFLFRGEIFKNCAECCRAYEVNKASVCDYSKKHNVSKQEAIEHYIFYISEKNGFLFRGEIFKNCAECCRTYEVKQTSVCDYSKKHNVSKQEAIEYYISKKNGFSIRDESFTNYIECCHKYKINPKNIIRYTRKYNVSQQEAIEYYLSKKNGFSFRDEIFTNYVECCCAYNLNYNYVYAYARKHNISKQEAIEYYLSKN